MTTFGATEAQLPIAVAYHLPDDFDKTAAIYGRICTTYDGPLPLAED